MLHGLLGYQRSSALFRPVCLSPDRQSRLPALLSPASPTSLVDSLDSELWLRRHLGRWAVFSAAFHHAERAPRVTGSLTAESPTIRSSKTSLVSIQGFSPLVSCAQGRLVNTSWACTSKAWVLFRPTRYAYAPRIPPQLYMTNSFLLDFHACIHSAPNIIFMKSERS